MHSFFHALTFVVYYTVPALSAVASAPIDVMKFDGQTNPNSYIVKLKNGVSHKSVFDWWKGTLHPDSAVTHDYDPVFYNGFAGRFVSNEIDILRTSTDVDYITEDGVVFAFDTQTDAPWGLARLSSNKTLVNQDPYTLNQIYKYDNKAGKNVDIYIIDTGIYTEHSDFGGRAKWGRTFGGYNDADGNGHGTHVAGIAASTHYGVAKAATLIAVKVLDDQGRGNLSDIIAGLEWVQAQVKTSNRSAVASMSLGGQVSLALDEATYSLIQSGVHCTVAAGNSNTDSSFTSPAHVTTAITVGATDISDSRAFYSNYGAGVDIYAPGSYITSTWINGSTGTISGTSMAAPFVAGLVAYFISTQGKMEPSQMSQLITSLAVVNELSNIPPGTVNAMANNGAL